MRTVYVQPPTRRKSRAGPPTRPACGNRLREIGPSARHPQIDAHPLPLRPLVAQGGAMHRIVLALSLAALLATAPDAGVAQGGARWRPPVTPVIVVAQFDPPAQRWLAGHRGVDLRTAPGARVRAAGEGRVAFAGMLAGRGVVSVDHGDLRTTYEPVDALVETGERVAAGETLGTVGTGTGHCGSGRCLHLGLRRGRDYLDPMLLLRPTSARLVPW